MDSLHPNVVSTFDAPSRQAFCFPRDVISFITQNPISPDGLLKLQKTCKYFFAKNKIIVVDKEAVYRNEKLFWCNKNIHEPLQDGKYWLNYDLRIFNSLMTTFSKNIYRCSLKKLNIFSFVTIFSWNELNFLLVDGKQLESIFFYYLDIQDENGIAIPINKILEKIPNILEFRYGCNNEVYSNETLETMNSLIFKRKLISFDLDICNLSSDINFVLLCDFIKKNTAFESVFTFQFHGDSEVELHQSFTSIAENEFRLLEPKPHFYINYELNMVKMYSSYEFFSKLLKKNPYS